MLSQENPLRFSDIIGANRKKNPNLFFNFFKKLHIRQHKSQKNNGTEDMLMNTT